MYGFTDVQWILNLVLYMFLPSELSVCTTAITQSCCLYTVMDGLWIGKGPWAIRSALRLWASSTELPLTWVVLVIGGPITSNLQCPFLLNIIWKHYKYYVFITALNIITWVVDKVKTECTARIVQTPHRRGCKRNS